jgi:hypothetical protein
MRFRLFALPLLFAFAAAAQQALSVDQLVSFIRSSISLKQTDKQVAGFLAHVKLTQRLDDRTIEQLQGEGAGPKTVEALRALSEQTKSLPAAKPLTPEAKPTPIPPPSSEEQARILDEVREYALNYTKGLPDYICTEVTRRYADPRGGQSWQLIDTLTARLSYYEQKEDYKLILVNNQMTQQSYNQLGGASSTGEFGSMLRDIFLPSTRTRFEWDHWGTLRNRRALVFKYRVSQLNSQWHIDYERRLDIIAGYHGFIYVDRETNQVLRVSLEAEDIPPSFPVQAARTVLDYDSVDISGHNFMLPLKAEVLMHSGGFSTRNDKEFRLYRKFSTESEIKFDTPPPLSEDQTKEEEKKPPK